MLATCIVFVNYLCEEITPFFWSQEFSVSNFIFSNHVNLNLFYAFLNFMVMSVGRSLLYAMSDILGF